MTLSLFRSCKMKEFTYTITDKDGMHARPAGRLAMRAKQFASNINVSFHITVAGSR